MNCPRCGCEIDEMADCCPGCLSPTSAIAMGQTSIPHAATYPPTIIAALIEVARAAWQLADDTEERDNDQFVCDPGDFSKLSAMLDVLEQLPEPAGEAATGPRKAEYWIGRWNPIYLP